MKKTIITLAVAALAAVGTSTGASAGNGTPTCSPNWENHGTHVREDYVFDEEGSATGAKGGPSHRMPDGTFVAPPGASFCVDANSHR